MKSNESPSFTIKLELFYYKTVAQRGLDYKHSSMISHIMKNRLNGICAPSMASDQPWQMCICFGLARKLMSYAFFVWTTATTIDALAVLNLHWVYKSYK